MTILIAIAIYYGQGYWLVTEAEEAYHNNADCQCVVETVDKIKRQYPASIAPYIDQVTPWAEVCQSFLSAEAKRVAGDWQQASIEVTKFLEVNKEIPTPIAQLAQNSLNENFFNWAEQQRNVGQYEAALEIYDIIKGEDEDTKAKVASERAQVYFDWAYEQHKAGQYEAALEIYDMIKAEDEDTKAKVAGERAQVYLAWVVNLRENNEIQQAENVLTDLWNIQEIDHQQALSVGLKHSDLMKALSRSTGEHAQQLIRKTLSAACNGQPSDSTAVAVSKSHHALVLNVTNLVRLTSSSFSDLKATMPGDLYYAICITEHKHSLDRCSYHDSSLIIPGPVIGYVVPQQIIWNVDIRDIRTGKKIDLTELSGSIPKCPSEAFLYKGETKYITGSPPFYRFI